MAGDGSSWRLQKTHTITTIGENDSHESLHLNAQTNAKNGLPVSEDQTDLKLWSTLAEFDQPRLVSENTHARQSVPSFPESPKMADQHQDGRVQRRSHYSAWDLGASKQSGLNSGSLGGARTSEPGVWMNRKDENRHLPLPWGREPRISALLRYELRMLNLEMDKMQIELNRTADSIKEITGRVGVLETNVRRRKRSARPVTDVTELFDFRRFFPGFICS